MGRATRWLKNLFGIKNKDENDRRHKKWSSIVNSGRENSATNATTGLCNNPETIPSNISDSEAAWLRSYCSETDKKRNKHAIAVAAATAAAADAAVAAAQAAFAVVRLTSHGRGTMFGGGRQRWAATKIQTLFRGYLAKRALRALKGLVKLQAHVRGYLIRKQAKATLHSMQALIRAQATVRSQRSRNLIKDQNNGARKSLETCDETRSEQTVSFHSRRLSASIDTSVISAIDESPKIMEVDSGSRHKVRSGRFINNSISEFCDDPPFQASSFPLPAKVHHRLSMLDVQNDSDWGLTGDECRFSTAQSTPRFISSGGSNNLLATPTKIGGDNFFCHYGNFPNYMANTQSYKAKSRSYSAPKQRPEPLPKKRLSLNELMDSRNSLSGVRMQRSCSQVQEATSFKNAVMGKLERSIDFSRDSAERNGFSRRW